MEKNENIETLKRCIKICKSFKYSVICLEKTIPNMIKSEKNISKIKDYFEDLFLFLDQYYNFISYKFSSNNEEINKKNSDTN